MQLIDEKNNLSFALPDLVQNRLQTLLKLTAVLGARHQCAHIQGKKLLILQSRGHIAPDDSLGQAFHHGSFADAGLPDEHRVVLGLPGQNHDHIPDLGISADDRIQLVVSCPLHQIIAVLIQGVIGILRVVADHPLVASHLGKHLQKTLPGNVIHPEDLLHSPVGLLQKTQEQVLHGDILISHGLCLILGIYQHLVAVLGQIDLTALHLRETVDRLLHLIHKLLSLNSHHIDELQDQAVIQPQQRQEQMLLINLLVAEFISQLLRILNRFHGFLRKFVDIHKVTPLSCYTGTITPVVSTVNSRVLIF